ncbi:glutaredoxin domain-containing protein [Cryptosporidium serpentis]
MISPKVRGVATIFLVSPKNSIKLVKAHGLYSSQIPKYIRFFIGSPNKLMSSILSQAYGNKYVNTFLSIKDTTKATCKKYYVTSIMNRYSKKKDKESFRMSMEINENKIVGENTSNQYVNNTEIKDLNPNINLNQDFESNPDLIYPTKTSPLRSNSSYMRSLVPIPINSNISPTLSSFSNSIIIDWEELKEELVKITLDNKIVLFIKGTPFEPKCGFSRRISLAMALVGVSEYKFIDVTKQPAIREGIKKLSNWPTIPQLYVDGIFIGGCDNVENMLKSGKLKQFLISKDVDLRPNIAMKYIK